MFRRPNARKDSIAKLQRAIPRTLGWVRDFMAAASGGHHSDGGRSDVGKFQFGIEALEERRLMHTFNSLGQANTYDFWTGTQVEEISFNDVVFEALGIFVDPTTGAAQLGMTPGDPTTTPVTPPADLPQATIPEPTQGENLYYIYVTQSNPDSYISIYVINPTTGTPEPFTGTTPSILGTNAQTGAPYLTAPSPNTGGVLIGDVDPVAPNTGAPYTGLPLTGGFGLIPDPGANGLNPGINVIPINATTGAPNNFGNFLIGGTLTGTATFGGNLNEFYAGEVLTGDIGGDPAAPQAAPTDARTDPNNFLVAGDLREFITNGPVGTDGVGGAAAPQYITSFDLNVGGKIGEIHIGNSEKGSTGMFAGTIEAGNSPLISGQTAYNTSSPANLLGIWTPTLEVENLAAPNPDAVFAQNPAGIDLRNDTAADAQVLGSIPILNALTGLPQKDTNGNIEYEASVSGNLDTPNGDANDFYSIGFEAGTTFQVTLSANTLDVFDPSGQLIASNTKSGTGPQQITTDRPGEYFFEVTGGTGTYTLTVTNVGNVAIGGIVTTGDFTDIGVNQGIIAGNGDLAVIDVGGTYISTTTGPTPQPADGLTNPNTTVPVFSNTSILVANGNLRSLVGAALGTQVNTAMPTGGPWLSVPNGSVGLVESTTGVLSLNSQFDPNFQNLTNPQFVTDDLYASAIGGSIQTIEAATTFGGDIATNGGIGSLLAANMGTDTPSYIDVNADNKGQDGIIDLIEVTGNFGTLAAGGPQFVTHDGGDIRYMLLLGSVFRDEFFGGGADNVVTYPAGQAVHFTDQAGNVVTITPIGPMTTTTKIVKITAPTNSSTGASTTTTTTVTGPQISFGAYQIRDKGGEVPVQITSTGSMSITSAGTGPNSAVNIASVVIEGGGSPIVNSGTDQWGNTTISQTPATFTAATNDGTTTTTTTAANGSVTTTITTISGGGTSTNLSLQLMGTAKINVLDAFAVTPGGAALSNPTLIENNTGGELASFQAANVGQILVHGNLGYTTPVATPAALEPVGVFQGNPEGTAGGYPFIGVNTGIGITGDAVNIDAYGGIGNVEVDGTLQSLIANYSVSTGNKGAKPIPGQFDGIVGPIEGGFLLNIDVGQGVLPTGTGLVAYSGIYGVDAIGTIDNNGNTGGAIRGNIVSEDDANFNTSQGAYLPGVAIGKIHLQNASIISSEIATVFNINGTAPFDNFSVTGDLGAPFVDPDTGEAPFTSPYIYEIGGITVTGKGGIIGADVEANNIGPIAVTNGGFGIIDSLINSQDLGRVAGLTASGYGIRDTNVTQCGYLGHVVATGNGSDISVLNYPIDVRESDLPGLLDPYFGFTPDADTDLNAALGTSLQTPNIPNVTDTGVIEDDVFQGQESFAGLTAQKVRTATPLYTNAQNGTVEPTPTVPNIPFIGVDFPMEINFAQSIGQIHIYQQVDGLQITTATLAGFNSGVSVNRLGISTAGELDAVLVHGNLGNFILNEATGQMIPDSYLNAGGPSGILGNIRVFGNLSANISATGVVQNVLVTGDLLGSLTAEGQSSGLTLGTLHVDGGIRDNSLTLDGNVGSIIVNGTLGTSLGTLTIQGNANLISVGANAKQKGSTLGLALDVIGTLTTLRVHGTITGTVNTGADLTNLVVTGDGTTPNVIDNTITVGGRLYKATVSNGNVDANITANGFINSFTINHGSLLPAVTLQSVLDSIHAFNITGGAGYGMYGALLASNGTDVNVNVSGSIGDGTDPATITANTAGTIKAGGIAANATITIAGQLKLLEVLGNIKAGAVISAHPLVTQKITGTNDGSITIV